jgi:alpha-L-rhamnosidase
MNRRNFLTGTATIGALAGLPRQALAAPNAWLAKAQALIPVLRQTDQPPVHLVRAVADAAQVLRFRMEAEAPAAALEDRLLGKGDSFILDFTGHRTGTIQFDLVGEGQGVDAPVRLKLTFGEVPTDVAEPLRPYKGLLAEGWLPEEIITIDYLPQTVRLPRRYAFRYVKVEIFDTSNTFKIRFRNMKAIAITSAGPPPPPLASGDALLDRIDAVSLVTLRDCMQTVFEDGPRRDQRLWIGDLRLQALTAYAFFGGHDLVKRCLYLFAAFPRPDGQMQACVYEKPTPASGGITILDYSALWNVTLADYLAASGDRATALDLWPVALRQVACLSAHIRDGLFVDPGNQWLFIDWAEKLDRTAAEQGVLIYAFTRTLELARALGREADVPGLAAKIAAMKAAAQTALFDPERGVYLSGAGRQLSWASQAWLVIAGVPRTRAQAARALRTAMADPAAIRPVTPYLYHYMVEAMTLAGMQKAAMALLKSYWGAMVQAGADSFWEVFDPANPLSSPYGDIHINSYCHAWSCTPAWFLRTGRLKP